MFRVRSFDYYRQLEDRIAAKGPSDLREPDGLRWLHRVPDLPLAAMHLRAPLVSLASGKAVPNSFSQEAGGALLQLSRGALQVDPWTLDHTRAAHQLSKELVEGSSFAVFDKAEVWDSQSKANGGEPPTLKDPSWGLPSLLALFPEPDEQGESLGGEGDHDLWSVDATLDAYASGSADGLAGARSERCDQLLPPGERCTAEWLDGLLHDNVGCQATITGSADGLREHGQRSLDAHAPAEKQQPTERDAGPLEDEWHEVVPEMEEDKLAATTSCFLRFSSDDNRWFPPPPLPPLPRLVDLIGQGVRDPWQLPVEPERDDSGPLPTIDELMSASKVGIDLEAIFPVPALEDDWLHGDLPLDYGDGDEAFESIWAEVDALHLGGGELPHHLLQPSIWEVEDCHTLGFEFPPSGPVVGMRGPPSLAAETEADKELESRVRDGFWTLGLRQLLVADVVVPDLPKAGPVPNEAARLFADDMHGGLAFVGQAAPSRPLARLEAGGQRQQEESDDFRDLLERSVGGCVRSVLMPIRGKDVFQPLGCATLGCLSEAWRISHPGASPRWAQLPAFQSLGHVRGHLLAGDPPLSPAACVEGAESAGAAPASAITASRVSTNGQAPKQVYSPVVDHTFTAGAEETALLEQLDIDVEYCWAAFRAYACGRDTDKPPTERPSPRELLDMLNKHAGDFLKLQASDAQHDIAAQVDAYNILLGLHTLTMLREELHDSGVFQAAHCAAAVIALCPHSVLYGNLWTRQALLEFHRLSSVAKAEGAVRSEHDPSIQPSDGPDVRRLCVFAGCSGCVSASSALEAQKVEALLRLGDMEASKGRRLAVVFASQQLLHAVSAHIQSKLPSVVTIDALTPATRCVKLLARVGTILIHETAVAPQSAATTADAVVASWEVCRLLKQHCTLVSYQPLTVPAARHLVNVRLKRRPQAKTALARGSPPAKAVASDCAANVTEARHDEGGGEKGTAEHPEQTAVLAPRLQLASPQRSTCKPGGAWACRDGGATSAVTDTEWPAAEPGGADPGRKPAAPSSWVADEAKPDPLTSSQASGWNAYLSQNQMAGLLDLSPTPERTVPTVRPSSSLGPDARPASPPEHPSKRQRAESCSPATWRRNNLTQPPAPSLGPRGSAARGVGFDEDAPDFGPTWKGFSSPPRWRDQAVSSRRREGKKAPEPEFPRPIRPSNSNLDVHDFGFRTPTTATSTDGRAPARHDRADGQPRRPQADHPSAAAEEEQSRRSRELSRRGRTARSGSRDRDVRRYRDADRSVTPVHGRPSARDGGDRLTPEDVPWRGSRRFAASPGSTAGHKRQFASAASAQGGRTWHASNFTAMEPRGEKRRHPGSDSMFSNLRRGGVSHDQSRSLGVSVPQRPHHMRGAATPASSTLRRSSRATIGAGRPRTAVIDPWGP